MDLLGGYASSSSEDDENKNGNNIIDTNSKKEILKRSRLTSSSSLLLLKKGIVSAAPPVVVSSSSSSSLSAWNHHPYVSGRMMIPSTLQQQHYQKEVEETVDWNTFDEQRKQFQRKGQALGPDGQVIVRGTYGHNTVVERISEEEEITNEDCNNNNNNNPSRKNPNKKKKRKQQVYDDDNNVEDDEVTHGIWAPASLEEKEWKMKQMSCVEKLQAGLLEELAPAQRAERMYMDEKKRQRGEAEERQLEEQSFDRLVERKVSHLLPPNIEEQPMEPTTTFHFPDQYYNYKGQPWITPPAATATADQTQDQPSFVPKKCVGRFPSGHANGVHRLRLFPNTGHLLLSAGLDGKCKVWNLQNKQCMRTYHGHTSAVRDVQFNSDGSKFISASFDRYIRLWNTETGEVINTFTNRRVPYVIQFYPKDDNLFVVGCSDNKIITYDATTAQITQEYNHHLAPVNTITFLQPPDSTIKMITSSDDKKVLIWEWDIAVPIKYVSDPTMHSMPVMTLHPSNQYILGQSLDNQIVVYQCHNDRFVLLKKKKFTSHFIAGYACDITISPDGRFVCSGDGNGNLFFWDWRKTKLLQKYRAHDNGPTIASIWHPTQPSTVYTCGWDGQIKQWQ